VDIKWLFNDGQSKTPRHKFGARSAIVPRGLGFVHHSRAIFCRAVPNPNITIRNFFIAVWGGVGRTAESGIAVESLVEAREHRAWQRAYHVALRIELGVHVIHVRNLLIHVKSRVFDVKCLPQYLTSIPRF
jgi:hypothetical protein